MDGCREEIIMISGSSWSLSTRLNFSAQGTSCHGLGFIEIGFHFLFSFLFSVVNVTISLTAGGVLECVTLPACVCEVKCVSAPLRC